MSSSSRLGIASKTCITARKSAAVGRPVAATPPVRGHGGARRSNLKNLKISSGTAADVSCSRSYMSLRAHVHYTISMSAHYESLHGMLGAWDNLPRSIQRWRCYMREGSARSAGWWHECCAKQEAPDSSGSGCARRPCPPNVPIASFHRRACSQSATAAPTTDAGTCMEGLDTSQTETLLQSLLNLFAPDCCFWMLWPELPAKALRGKLVTGMLACNSC